LSDLSKNIQVDKGGNRLICFASPRVIMEIERIVMALDKPHTLVMLETRLIEVSVDKMNQYGLKYDMLGAERGLVGTTIEAGSVPVRDFFSLSNAERGPLNLNVIIDMMVTNGDARILMDSKLTTTNNREASLHIGEVIPYTIQSYNLTSSGGVNQQIEKENVGVLLKMTPHINGDNQITLALAPEVSNIIGWRSDVPLIRTRKTNTTVRVENGQTVILAGLLSEEKTTTLSKVPILGDIPVLGLLFQNKREEVRKTNLIIEVVPRIITDPAEIARYMNVPGHGRRGPRGRGTDAERAERRQQRMDSRQQQAIIVEETSSAAPAPALPAAPPSVDPAHGAPISPPAVTAPATPAVTAPAVTAPATPAVTAPAVTAPAVTAPAAAPAVTAPAVTAPAVTAPAVTAPVAPAVTAPAVTAPAVTAPAAPAVTAPATPAPPAPAAPAAPAPPAVPARR
jgi:Flp pilus assembly secretin CpaC